MDEVFAEKFLERGRDLKIPSDEVLRDFQSLMAARARLSMWAGKEIPLSFLPVQKLRPLQRRRRY